MSFDISKVNPVVRVILSVIMAILQTFSSSLCSRVLLFFVALLLTVISRSKIKINFRFFVVVFSIVCMSSFFCSRGETIFEFGFIKLSYELITTFLTMILSTMTFWIFSVVFLNSISPDDVSYVVNFLMFPMKKLNVNVNEISMIIILALRFMPVILSESKKIMIVQESRGAEISSGSFFKKIKYMLPMFVPIFSACFRRAINVSLAMESRCYGAPYKKTNLYKNKFRSVDLLFCILTLCLIIGVLYCNHIKIF